MQNKNIEYHQKQFIEPKRSTVQFVDWLDDKIMNTLPLRGGIKILDMACGAAANTFYRAEKYPNINFTGIDYEQSYLDLCELHASNVTLEQGDWYNIDKKYVGKFDGIISFQSLLLFPDYKEPLIKLIELNPKWVALTSLFYEGKMNFYTKIDNYEDDIKNWGSEKYFVYNIYSLPMIKELFAEYGYTHFEYKKFEIDIDLPKPEKPGLGTYTVQTVDGGRLQISAALLMPWYFVLARK